MLSITADAVNRHQHASDGGSHIYRYEFDDSDIPQTKIIELRMWGKNHHHTQIDNDGNIISDSAILTPKILLEQIDVTELWCQGLACYRHNNNGSSQEILDEYYGYMGHNGVVTWSFSVPLYKWFLSHCR